LGECRLNQEEKNTLKLTETDRKRRINREKGLFSALHGLPLSMGFSQRMPLRRASLSTLIRAKGGDSAQRFLSVSPKD